MDKFFAALSIIGLLLLAFIAGGLAMHYRLAPAEVMEQAIESIKAWREALSAPPVEEHTLPGQKNIPFSLASLDKKITWDKARAYNGSTLITLRYSTTATLIDMEGNELHHWDMPFRKAFPNPTHVHALAKAFPSFEKAYMFPNGDLLVNYYGWLDTPYGYGMVKMDKNSNVLWTYAENTHHDFYVDEHTGEIYALIHKFIDVPPKGMEGLSFPMLADYVVKLSPEGKELERISMLDAFKDTPFELLLYAESFDPQKKWDGLHTNAIQKLEPELAAAFPMFSPGQLLVSVRNLNALVILDPKTKKIVWAKSGPWKAQHAPRFQNDGTILLFDNLGHFENGDVWSRIMMVDPKTGAITWHYSGSVAHPFYNYAYGRLQVLPNEDILITNALTSQITEINRKGETVWELKLSDNNFGAGSNAIEPRGTPKPELRTTVMDATRINEE